MDSHRIVQAPRLGTIKSFWQTVRGEVVSLAGMKVIIPGPLPIRLAVVLGNLRMQRMLDSFIQPGDTVVDVGANIGYHTLYAAQRTGPQGHVYAVEPAQDNLTVLYANLLMNRLRNVSVLPYAAGSSREIKRFFLRGKVSAVNSFYQENFYHPVTETIDVLAAPLDDLVSGSPKLVKIDVEGGEIEVLRGMSRMLTTGTPHLIVEWHPALQEAAGHAPTALPYHLFDLGFQLSVVTHTSFSPLQPAEVTALASKLFRKRSPVELLAIR